MAVVGMWEENGKWWIWEGTIWNLTFRALRRRVWCGGYICFITTSIVWIITCFQFYIPMQVCRTFLAIGLIATAVKEPMAVVGMWEENGQWCLLEGTIWNLTFRALRRRLWFVCRRSCSSGCSSFFTISIIWIITCFQLAVPMQVYRTFLAICHTVTAVIEPTAVDGIWEENGKFWILSRACWYPHSV
jgi:hypothetical protein